VGAAGNKPIMPQIVERSQDGIAHIQKARVSWRQYERVNHQLHGKILAYVSCHLHQRGTPYFADIVIIIWLT
jgi:hypothetical protein